MITHLQIQGLAIIDSLSIDFSKGFNVITGETGAGKSILIRALHFLMGGKPAPDTVRKGADLATVVGEFWVPKTHRAAGVLEKLGIAYDVSEAGIPILIRRQLTAKGRSQSWINDVIVTSNPLRELGMSLVDVFGQHENQRLMDASQHLSYIDNFLESDVSKSAVENLNRECQRKLNELENMLETYYARVRSKDYLSFRLDELEKFSPAEKDYDAALELSQKADGLMHVRETLGKAVTLVEGDEEGKGISQTVKDVARLLAQLSSLANSPMLSAKGSALHEEASQIARSLDDFNYELTRYASEFDVDEGELEEAQDRLFGYQELFRKHSVRDIQSLLSESDRLKTEIEFLESASTQIQETLEKLDDLASKMQKEAAALTGQRKKAAKSIKKLVEVELHELAMPGSVLEIEFTGMLRSLPLLNLEEFNPGLAERWKKSAEKLKGVGEKGAERGQFLLASNPGEPLLALSRVASGGELSRIMLALKKALAADAETCVLVFDEIDTGISGRVADVVGKKMRELSSTFQVICISHLPQVAVYADTHFLVAKAGKGKRTETSIVRLTADESAHEIARLLSGAEVSKSSLANARALMEKARRGGERAVSTRTRARKPPDATV